MSSVNALVERSQGLCDVEQGLTILFASSSHRDVAQASINRKGASVVREWIFVHFIDLRDNLAQRYYPLLILRSQMRFPDTRPLQYA